MTKNKEKWIQRLNEWEARGIKRSQYCQEHGIPITTFDYWRRKIRIDSEEISNPKSSPDLVKLPILFSPSKANSFILEYPGGFKLQIPENYDSMTLKTLVSDLKDVLK